MSDKPEQSKPITPAPKGAPLPEQPIKGKQINFSNDQPINENYSEPPVNKLDRSGLPPAKTPPPNKKS